MFKKMISKIVSCVFGVTLTSFVFRKIGYAEGLMFIKRGCGGKHKISDNTLASDNRFVEQCKLYMSSLEHYEFCKACANNELKLAKNLLSTYPHINVSANEETAFRWACSSGNLNVAKWLLSIKPDINVSIGNNHAFFMAALYGDNKELKVTRWLLSIKPDIINSNIIDNLITFSVFKRKPEIIKLIIEKNQNVNLTNVFIEACNRKCNISKHIIQSTNIFKYSVKNNCITNNCEFYVLVYIFKKTNNLNKLSLWNFAKMVVKLCT